MNNQDMTPIEFKAQKACELDTFNTINIVGIKQKVQSMLGMIGRDGIFDEYTKHDISHINQMLRLLDIIIPENTFSQLTEADSLLIVLSIYFHDLGMLVTKNEFKNRETNGSYLAFRSKYINDRRNAEALKPLAEHERERFVYQEYVRKRHGQRISDWLTNSNEEDYDFEVVNIVRGMVEGLKPMFIQDIARICVSHNEDDIDDFTKYPVKRSYGLTSKETGNVNYAAIILRTADMMHITSDRTPSILLSLISPTNPVSQLEWSKQSQVSGVFAKPMVDAEGNVDNQKQSDTLAVSGYFEDEKGYFALMEYLQYARRQLQQSFRTNEKAKKKFSTTYDFPWKDINDEEIDAKDFEKRQLVFSVDQQKILDLLVGETLYNNLNVSLRELSQNAIDAVKVKKFELEKEGAKDYEPKVEVEWLPDTRELLVIDNGTGMDLEIIENHLLKVGSSRYQDPEFQKTHQGYNSISRFGIGLLSCFLVADDVDILTNMKQDNTPLLLKVRKLHGRYLLRHGNEKDSKMRFIDKTGTCIKLKIRPDIDYNPLSILKEWVLMPQCEFSYLEAGKKQAIGYKSTKELLTDVLKKRGFVVDGQAYKIFEHQEEGVDCSILLRYNAYLKEWSFVQFSEIANNDGFDVEPCGLAIEGIRIDDSTPGYRAKYLVAMVNLYGENAPRTNVARSSINSQTMRNMLETVYGGYLDVVTSQVSDLSKSYSPTWASAEMNYLLNRLLTNSENRRDLLLDGQIFNSKLNEQKYYLIEKDGNRQFSSLEELMAEGHFWTIDSAAYQSANNLIREVNTTNYSAISILKNLYGEDSPILKDIDVTLTKNRYFNSLDDILLANFQVSIIHLFEENRTLNLNWEVKQKEKTDYWSVINCHNISRGPYGQHSLFLQKSDKVQILATGYEGIRTDFGIFVPKGGEMHQYLSDLYEEFCKKPEEENYMLNCVASFVYNQYTKGGKDTKWDAAFKEFVKRSYAPPYISEIIDNINMERLVKACNNCSFTLYDKSRWYREKINY